MPSDSMVKLTNGGIKWLIIRVSSCFSTVKKAAHCLEWKSVVAQPPAEVAVD